MEKYIIDIFAVAISLGTLIYTIFDGKSKEKKLVESERKAERALKLSEGSMELGLRNSISSARDRVNTSIRDLHHFKNKYQDRDDKIMTKLFYSALEDLLNHYERACMLYIDNKIDKDRFKIEYFIEIRNVVEKGEYKEKYFPAHTSRYKAILKVYDEWENLEK